MVLSELTAEIVKDYCGISDSDSDEIIENVLIPAAKSFISGYTGLNAAELDKHEEITTAAMILVNDLYTQREYTLSWQKQVNPAVSAILGLYAVNYL